MFVPAGYESYDEDDDFFDNFIENKSDEEDNEFIIIKSNDSSLKQNSSESSKNLIKLKNFPDLKISFDRDTFAKKASPSDDSQLLLVENLDNKRKKTNTKKEKEISFWFEIDIILFDEMKKYPCYEDNDDHELFLSELFESIKYKKKDVDFINILSKCWIQVRNPLLTAFHLIQLLGKKIFHINLLLRNLNEFLHRVTFCNSLNCSDELKKYNYLCIIQLKAFIFFAKTQALPNTNLYDACFQISSGDKILFINIINILLDHHEYLKASRCINLANLNEVVSVEKICFPLMFQGHSQEIEKFLNGHKKQQEIFISGLDQLFDDPDNLNSKIRNYGIPNVRFELITSKSLQKLALRLAKLYNIDESFLMNISLNQNKKTIRYFVYRRYVLKDLIGEEWSDLIQSCVKRNKKLQLFFIDCLMEYNDCDEVCRFIKLFHLPIHLIPYQITDSSIQHEATNQKHNSIDKSLTDIYYTLSLPFENIIWVDNRVLFHNAIDSIKKEGPYIGFDAEWKPCFIKTISNSKVSIIQLATRHKVYLLDILMLLESLNDLDWIKLADQVFGCDQLYILGYGCHSDFPNLFQTIPILKQCSNMQIVDLAHYHLLMKSTKNEDTVNMKGGLVDLATICLTKPIDKRQQMSDWERRPLRKSQIIYAAIDAYCLLDICDKLSEQFPELKSNACKKRIRFYMQKFERKQLNATIQAREKQERRFDEEFNGEKQGCRLLYSSPSSSMPSSPTSVKIICDSMLMGLGRSLRSCGFDVHPIERNMDQRQLVEISKKEKSTDCDSALIPLLCVHG